MDQHWHSVLTAPTIASERHFQQDITAFIKSERSAVMVLLEHQSRSVDSPRGARARAEDAVLPEERRLKQLVGECTTFHLDWAQHGLGRTTRDREHERGLARMDAALFGWNQREGAAEKPARVITRSRLIGRAAKTRQRI